MPAPQDSYRAIPCRKLLDRKPLKIKLASEVFPEWIHAQIISIDISWWMQRHWNSRFTFKGVETVEKIFSSEVAFHSYKSAFLDRKTKWQSVFCCRTLSAVYFILPQGQSRLPREEDGTQMIKAVQLDDTAECVVEVPLADVELLRTSTGTESVLPRWFVSPHDLW